MISFFNKKILISRADSNLGQELSIKLDKLGAKLVLIGENERKLKETISLLSDNKQVYHYYNFNDAENINELISMLVAYDNIRFDGYIHCEADSIHYNNCYEDFESFLKKDAYFYTSIINYLSQEEYSNNNMSILFLSSNFRKNILERNLLGMANHYAISNLSKILSIKYMHRQVRVNSVLSNFNQVNLNEKDYLNNYLEKTSNVVIYLMSESAKYIVGEEYVVDNY